MNGNRTRLMILVIVLGLVGCRATAPDPAVSPADVAGWLQNMDSLEAVVQAVEAEGTMEMTTRDGRHERVHAYWAVARPDRALFELTGGPVGLVGAAALDGRRMVVLDMTNKVVRVGKPTRRTVEAFAHIDIEPADLVATLLGMPRRLPEPVGHPTYDSNLRRWRIARRDTEKQLLQVLWFESDGRLYRQRLIDKKNDDQLEVTFLGWTQQGPEKRPYPGFIKLVHQRTGAKLTLKVSGSPRFNPSLADDFFSLSIPESFQRIDLPDAPAE